MNNFAANDRILLELDPNLRLPKNAIVVDAMGLAWQKHATLGIHEHVWMSTLGHYIYGDENFWNERRPCLAILPAEEDNGEF